MYSYAVRDSNGAQRVDVFPREYGDLKYVQWSTTVQRGAVLYRYPTCSSTLPGVL